MSETGSRQDVPRPVDVAVLPVVALAVLAAVERDGHDLRRRVGGATVAAWLCDRDQARDGDGGGWAARLTWVLGALTGTSPHDAVAALVTGPLGVAGGVRLDEPAAPRASGAALEAVMRAWLRLTCGEPEPDLAAPSPGTVRRAWALASHLDVARGPAGAAPAWRGPGMLRNLGGVLSPVASPLAFGQRSADGLAVALADPLTGAVAAVVVPDHHGAAAAQAAIDAALPAGGPGFARAAPRPSA